MSEAKKEIEESHNSIFRLFHLLTEIGAWLRIVASPMMIGIIIGAFIYFSNPGTTSLIFAGAMVCLGLMIGIVWANRQWKGKGTVWFMLRVGATPELDEPDAMNTTDPA